MVYPFLAFVFFSTLCAGFCILLHFLYPIGFWSQFRWRLLQIYLGWVAVYILFILFGTGPGEPRTSAPAESPYKLPWQSGDSRFVSQGNRSFISHRDRHLFAWDFWMPIGTEILAARSGTVMKIQQNYEGIGFNANYISILHEDGTRGNYVHIKKDSALVKTGDRVEQGQPLALSGMVGQTINPHLHFVVKQYNFSDSVPIVFSDVPEDGVPRAGHFYESKNLRL